MPYNHQELVPRAGRRRRRRGLRKNPHASGSLSGLRRAVRSHTQAYANLQETAPGDLAGGNETENQERPSGSPCGPNPRPDPVPWVWTGLSRAGGRPLMPIYEYRCLRCEKSFERLWLSLEAGRNLPVCPRCGSTETEVIPSRPARVGREEGGTSSCGEGGGVFF